jgi:thioredoxin 1
LFCSVDIDQVPESADKAKVSAMPTFQFYKDGKIIHEVRGANKAGLEKDIRVCNY